MQTSTIIIKHSRVNSLDILRSIAIILVMIFHYSVYISHKNDFGAISKIGWIGVDLFFVLSGYLISNQIFISLQLENFSLIKFYTKRFFKTLPNYYFVLAIYFIIPSFAEKPIVVDLWKYMIFIQNFNLTISGFSQSWSLCVEEQFYLLFPIFAMLLYPKHKKIFIGSLILIMFCGLFLRGMLWQHLNITNNMKNFTTIIYYPTYCRLDGFISGIIVAFLQNNCHNIWNKITKYHNHILILGITLIISFTNLLINRTSFLATVFLFPGLSISFAIIIASALSNNSLLSKYKIKICNKLALWSYAIYLIQKPISVICANYFNKIGFNNESYLIIFMNFMIEIFVGYLIFYFIENKFMLIRNKILDHIK